MDLDFALVADYAEVIAGKLYLMGGGWDTLHVPNVPAAIRFAVALGVRFEWDETNRQVPIRVTVEDDDGAAYARAEGSVSVGRPPDLPPGSPQVAKLALVLGLSLPRYGGYRVLVTAGEGEAERTRSLPFRLVRAPTV
jgi:hypothetical protein